MSDRSEPSAQSEPSETPQPRRLTGSGLLGLGIANAAALVVGLILGHVADQHFGSAPAGVLVGGASGIVVGILGTALEIRRYLD